MLLICDNDHAGSCYIILSNFSFSKELSVWEILSPMLNYCSVSLHAVIILPSLTTHTITETLNPQTKLLLGLDSILILLLCVSNITFWFIFFRCAVHFIYTLHQHLMLSLLVPVLTIHFEHTKTELHFLGASAARCCLLL